jgi:hypothetical protein
MSEGPTTNSAVAGSAGADARHIAPEPTRRGGRTAVGEESRGVPHRKGRPAPWKLVTEVVFISLGVFLALLADQWREDRQTGELAASSLREFRSEIVANREKVVAVKDYRVELLNSLRRYLAADAAMKPGIFLADGTPPMDSCGEIHAVAPDVSSRMWP